MRGRAQGPPLQFAPPNTHPPSTFLPFSFFPFYPFTLPPHPLTTFTLFDVPAAEWRRGLAQMGTTPAHLRGVPGLRWGRMLGSGVDFGLRPNLRRYALLAEWTDEAAARQFLAADPLLARFAERGWTWRTTWLQPVQTHGRWDGLAPFRPAPTTAPLADHEPVAVLTRAAIRWRRLGAFWRAVPATARAVAGAPGLQFSVGLGELPLVRQATVSIWESGALMKQYAYRAPEHQQVIKRTRAEGWYEEEMFARFRVVEDERRLGWSAGLRPAKP